MKPKKPTRAEPGDIFAIPNGSGGYYVGQVAQNRADLHSVFCYFFDAGPYQNVSEVSGFEPAKASLVSASFVTPDLLRSGRWTVVGSKALRVTENLIHALNTGEDFDVGQKIFGASLVSQFMDTFNGLLESDYWAMPEMVAAFFNVAKPRRR